MDEPTETVKQPLRESIVATAVAFLKNDKVRQSPIQEKKTFLQKKGLTGEEIEEAIRILGLPPDNLPPPALPPPTTSRLSSLLPHLLFFSVASYACYHFYKRYVKRLLSGDEQQSSNEVMQQLLGSSQQMNAHLGSMLATLNDLHRQVARNNSQLLLNDTSQELRLATNEVREEVRSLKALLLSRNQFPATSAPASLPAWQLTSKPPGATPSSQAIVGDGSVEEEASHEGNGDALRKDAFCEP